MEIEHRFIRLTGIVRRGKNRNRYSYIREWDGEVGTWLLQANHRVGDRYDCTESEWYFVDRRIPAIHLVKY